MDDGGYITVNGSLYWIGIVCGCDNKDIKELETSIRKKQLKVIRKQSPLKTYIKICIIV